MNNRRQFITLLGGAAAAWPITVRAQQPRLPVIGWLNSGSPGPTADSLREFRRGLADGGYVEGQNLAIEFRFANGRYDQMPALVDDLVRRQVAVIVASNAVAAAVAKTATTTIPIVFSVGVDPVESGLVRSLNRPGGNLTGAGSFSVELGPKRLELLHELVPNATRPALLINPTNPNTDLITKELQLAATALGLQLSVFHASTEGEIETALAAMSQERAQALVIGADNYFSSRSEQLGALTLRHAIPAISQYVEFAAAGGLMSYGVSRTDALHLLGIYTGRILKGEKPADLPVQQLTKIELIINLKTAKALGLTVPITLLGRADEIIE
jgi:putative ABC transport system substrate-binding protein